MTDYLDPEAEVTEEVAEETETQPEEEATPEEAPELTPAQIAQAWLKEQGIEDLDVKKVRNLSQWERDVNAKASDLGNIAKALETKEPVEETTLDADTKAELAKALKEVYGIDPAEMAEVIKSTKENAAAEREAAFSEFLETHTDVPADKLVAELMETGFNPNAPVSVIKQRMEKAYKTLSAPVVDEEAIRAKAIEDFKAELASKGVNLGAAEVKKGRGAAAGAHRSLDEVVEDSSVSLFDKWTQLQDVKLD